MKLDRVIAVRNKKTIYRDGDRCIKVFNEDYSKADILIYGMGERAVLEIAEALDSGLEAKYITWISGTCIKVKAFN